MVYITFGTKNNDFTRCLKEVEKLINDGLITDKVVAQVGYTKYRPQGVECIDFVSETDYQKYIMEASVVISHAGSGALFSAIKTGKKTIAVARLAKYGEMANAHQTELVKKLANEGYILDGTYDMKAAWEKVPTFEPRKNDFHCEISNRIEQLLTNWGISKRDNE